MFRKKEKYVGKSQKEEPEMDELNLSWKVAFGWISSDKIEYVQATKCVSAAIASLRVLGDRP